MKRSIVSFGCAAAAALALAACGSSSSGDDSGSGGGSTTLKMTWQAGQEKAVDPVVAAFEKANPTIKVDVQYLPVDTYGQVVQTRFQSGNGPDLVWGSPGTGNSNAIGTLQQQGKLLDLSSQSYASSVPKITGLYDGSTLYGIPIGVFPVGMMVNMKALKASGTTVPTTFAQLLTQCKTAASHGKAFVSVAGQGAGLGSLFLATLGSQWVLGDNPDWSAQRAAGSTKFADTAGWKTAISRYTAMKDAKCYPAGAAGIGTPQQISQLSSGKAVTGVVPADALSQIAATVKGGDFKMYPFPGDTVDATRLPISFGQGLAINKASKHTAQAQKFLEYLAQPAGQKLLANGLGALSLADYNAGALTGALAGLKDTISAKHTVSYIALEFPNANVLTVLGNDVTGLLTGQTSPEAALTNLDKAWDGSK
jgi:raffinose/stachyose/melibiose transport system substrate-binding protein